MAFDIPRDTILPVEAVDVRLAPDPHPFERNNSDAIARNWIRETEANPALFDGTVVLLSELAYRERVLHGRCHAVRYSTFLHWRRNRALSGAEHAYAHALLAAADNTLVAIRMAPHTVNAGKVYFAAGSFEPVDFADGRVDVDANMMREVREETGLDIGEARRDPLCHALSTPSGTVIYRRYRLDQKADDVADAIRGFVAREAEPEISEPVLIRGPDDLPEGLMPHMLPLIRWHFSG